jgi:hypothetical protein
MKKLEADGEIPVIMTDDGEAVEADGVGENATAARAISPAMTTVNSATILRSILQSKSVPIATGMNASHAILIGNATRIQLHERKHIAIQPEKTPENIPAKNGKTIRNAPNAPSASSMTYRVNASASAQHGSRTLENRLSRIARSVMQNAPSQTARADIM